MMITVMMRGGILGSSETIHIGMRWMNQICSFRIMMFLGHLWKGDNRDVGDNRNVGDIGGEGREDSDGGEGEESGEDEESEEGGDDGGRL